MIPSCYTASKIEHAAKWRRLRRDVRVKWTAHWPDIAVDSTADNSKWFWQIDHQDIANSDFVLVYAEPGEHLRGALFEAGIAIGTGKRVVVVGEHSDYGTWQYHPGVLRAPDLDAAIEIMIKLYSEGPTP